jgi:copper chaperone NosL
MNRLTCRALVVALAGFLATAPARAADAPPPPGKQDKCPVCGMFVHKYPQWVAAVVHQDGKTAFFDGPKDMFRYLFEVARYAPGRSRADVRSIWVTEYYDTVLVPAETAFFVIDSNVLGPMGRDVVPLRTRQDADGFMTDHKGVRVLTFGEVTQAVVASLDQH